MSSPESTSSPTAPLTFSTPPSVSNIGSSLPIARHAASRMSAVVVGSNVEFTFQDRMRREKSSMIA